MTTQIDLTLDIAKLRQGAWLVNRVDVNYAAQSLEIGANWDDEREFRLIFKDFRLLSWQILDVEPHPKTVNADVIGMEFGERAHGKPAILTTDLFEIILTYDELTIEKAW